MDEVAGLRPEAVLPAAVRAQLAAEGVPVPVDAAERLAQYGELVARWNAFSGLMSRNELPFICDHVVDALSLCRFLIGSESWLDIGSGGGFPAIPLKIVLPEAPLILLERNSKKVGFLRKAVGALGLAEVDIIHGAFPESVAGRRFSHVTARAVEKPAVIVRAARPFVAEGAQFLVQSGDPAGVLAGMFHVEHVEDMWKTRGWRRGSLHLIRSHP